MANPPPPFHVHMVYEWPLSSVALSRVRTKKNESVGDCNWLRNLEKLSLPLDWFSHWLGKPKESLSTFFVLAHHIKQEKKWEKRVNSRPSAHLLEVAKPSNTESFFVWLVSSPEDLVKKTKRTINGCKGPCTNYIDKIFLGFKWVSYRIFELVSRRPLLKCV